MSAILRVVDQIPGSSLVRLPDLDLSFSVTTAREVVRRRVEDEIARLNAGQLQHPSLVTPQADERRLNGERERRPINPEASVTVALEALAKGRIIFIFDGHQIEDLDAPLLVTPDSEVRFLRLVQLVGG